MFKPHITKTQLSAIIAEMPDIDFARFLYCQHMASTHLAVGQFEHMLISAMWMCDRAGEKALGAAMERWQQAMLKNIFYRVDPRPLISSWRQTSPRPHRLSQRGEACGIFRPCLFRGAWPGTRLRGVPANDPPEHGDPNRRRGRSGGYG